MAFVNTLSNPGDILSVGKGLSDMGAT